MPTFERHDFCPIPQKKGSAAEVWVLVVRFDDLDLFFFAERGQQQKCGFWW